MRFEARRFDTGQVVRVTIAGGRIEEIVPGNAMREAPWLAPGLIDLQINGFQGVEYNDAGLTVSQHERLSQACDAMGVTGYCATITTHSHDVMVNALHSLACAARESSAVARRLIGIHVEGPYISPEDGPRGAHPRNYCRPPNWDEFRRFQEAAEGRICLLTLSPEHPGSEHFIRRVMESGVVVAIGHTNANSDQMRAAVDAGATLSTHLGNGSHAMIRRHPNYIWDQLAEDRLIATLIVDGYHLPASVVQCFVRAKTPDRCLLVSDIVGLAGMPPGIYPSAKAGQIEILADGRLVVAGQNQYLFGASLSLLYGVANVMRFADVGLPTAIHMASSRPLQALGRTPARLEPGECADLILFDVPSQGPLQLRATLNAGELVHGAIPA